MNIILLTIKIIPKSFRTRSLLLLFLFFLGSLLEILSIGIFLPLLTELTNTNTEIIEKFKIILKDNLEFLNIYNWTTIFVVLIIVVFFVKNVLLSLIIYYENKFVENLTVTLSTKLYGIYLKQNYLFHKVNNSSKLLRNINIEVATFIVFLKNILKLVSELFFISGIFLLMIYFNVMLTVLTISIFFILLYLYNLFTTKYIAKLGHMRHDFSNVALKNLQQGLGGIKEIKIGNLEELILKIYRHSLNKIASAVSIFTTLQQMPRLMIEFSVVFFVSILLLMSFEQNENSYLIMIIGVFSITAIKAIPSILKIYLAIQQANFNLAAVSTLAREFSLKTNNIIYKKNKNFSFKKIILKNISFEYAKRNFSLKNISLKISKGEKIAIVGESGAGKSTLVDILIGLINPSKGTISVDRLNLKYHKKDFQNLVGYVPQNVYLTDDTISKNISLFSENESDKKQLKKVMEIANIHKIVNTLPKKLETKIGERGQRLSSGQIQRLGIARALYKNPKIIILDEPTSALDKYNEKKIINEIIEIKDVTLIMITHSTKYLKNFDKIIHMKNGKISKITNNVEKN